MKRIFLFAFVALTGFAIERTHQIYVEPDVFWSQHKFTVEDQNAATYGKFYGIDFGYKFSLPNSVYLALEGLYASGRAYHYLLAGKESFPIGEGNVTQRKLECNLGINYQFSRFTLIPFLGIGDYYQRTRGIRATLDYIPIGCNTSYSVNEAFDVGLNAKVFLHFYEMEKIEGRTFTGFIYGRNDWGGEVAVPFSLRTEGKNRWEAQVEPYFFMFDIQSALYFFGTRFNVGYSF